MLVWLTLGALAGQVKLVTHRPAEFVPVAPLDGSPMFAHDRFHGCYVGVGIPAGESRASHVAISLCDELEKDIKKWVKSAQFPVSDTSRWELHRVDDPPVALPPPYLLEPGTSQIGLYKPSAPPVWPEGYDGPAATCTFGGVWENHALVGLRSQPDCPPELVEAAWLGVRKDNWRRMVSGGVTYLDPSTTWDQVFRPPNPEEEDLIGYGWRQQDYPPVVSVEPVHKNDVPVRVERAFVTVGPDGVPIAVAVHTKAQFDPPQAVTVRRAARSEVEKLSVSDPAADLLTWRWPEAEAAYRVAWPPLSSNEPTFQGGEVVGTEPPSIRFPSLSRGVETEGPLAHRLVIPPTGPLRFHPVIGIRSNVPDLAVDQSTPWSRVEHVLTDRSWNHPSFVVWFDSSAPRRAQLHRVGDTEAGSGSSVVQVYPDHILVDGERFESRDELRRASSWLRGLYGYVRVEDGVDAKRVFAVMAMLEEPFEEVYLAPRVQDLPPELVTWKAARATQLAEAAEREKAARKRELEGGVIGGQGGGLVPVLHHSEVRWKRRTQPKYPEVAKGLNLGNADCKVRIFLDASGKPTRVTSEKCPQPLFDEVEATVMKGWTAYPIKVSGQKVPTQTVILFRFVAD